MNCRDCKFCVPSKTPVFWFTKARWEFSRCSNPVVKKHWDEIRYDVDVLADNTYPYTDVARQYYCDVKMLYRPSQFEPHHRYDGFFGKIKKWFRF